MLLPGLTDRREEWLGLRFFLAIVALILVLYFGNVVARIPLNLVAWLTVVTAAIGWFLSIRNIKRTDTNSRDFRLSLLCHPVIVIPVIFLILIFIRGDFAYQPYLGDEFGSWLRITRQIYLANDFWSAETDYHLGAYTNGWPLLAAFPSLFFGEFSEARASFIQLLMHVGLIGFTYDCLVWIAAKAGRENLSTRQIIAWVGILVILGGEASWKLLPTDLLIDRPSLYFLLVFFLVGLMGQFIAIDRMRASIFLGALLAAGYLIKVSMLSVVLGLGVYWLSFVVRDGYLSDFFNGRRRAFFKNGGLMAGAMLAPLGLAVATWSVRRVGTSCQASISGFLQNDSSLLVSGAAFDVFFRMVDALLLYTQTFKLPLTLFSLGILAASLFTRRFSLFVVGLLVFGMTYSGAVYASLVFCLNAITRPDLESFQRFMRLPFRIIHFLGLILFFIWMIQNVSAKWMTKFQRHMLFEGKISWTHLGIVLLVLGGSVQIWSLNRSVTDISTRQHQGKELIHQVKLIKGEAESLRRHLLRLGRKTPSVSLIDQGGYTVAFHIANYYGIHSRRNDNYFAYKLQGPFSWSEGTKRPYTANSNSVDLIAHWKSMDVIWPVKTDTWIRPILESLVTDPACKRAPEDYFLVNDGDGKFTCVAKKG